MGTVTSKGLHSYMSCEHLQLCACYLNNNLRQVGMSQTQTDPLLNVNALSRNPKKRNRLGAKKKVEEESGFDGFDELLFI